LGVSNVHLLKPSIFGLALIRHGSRPSGFTFPEMLDVQL
jgi:hypothetical protein